MRKTKFFIAITSIIIGCGIALLLCPLAFFYLPNSNKRFLHIKKYFHDKPKQNVDVIFLGNSIVMNGVDAKYYSKLCTQTAFNLSTPGQSFFESLFVIENVTTPKKVVLGCTPQSLVSELKNIPPNNINSLFMFDYQLSDTAVSIIEKCQGEKTLKFYHQSFFQHNIYSRWIIFSGVNTFFRSLLRKDLQLKNAQCDMFYPRPYVKKISPRALLHIQKRRGVKRNHFAANPNRIQFLQAFSAYLREKNIDFTLIILPEHPYIKNHTPADFYQNMQRFLDHTHKKLDFTVHNFYDILNKSMFIDHIHPSQQGAKKLTEVLAKKLSLDKK